MFKRLRWLILIVLVIVVLAGGGFVLWASNPLPPMPEALAALESSEAVRVSQGDWIVFYPEAAPPEVGFIFYPGGRVAAEAYAPFLHEIAAEGYLAVIVPMPLNLAILGINRGLDVMAAFPEVTHWAVGGHSLGGSMAARFAFDHPDSVTGLVIWAAYPEADRDFSARGIAAASIYGEFDGLATVAQVEDSRPLFPADADFVLISGGNHAQFGWYGEQDRDLPATITRTEQQAQTVSATLAVLARLNPPAD